MNLFQKNYFWATFSFLLLNIPVSVQAFSVTLNSSIVVGEVDNNVNASSTINTTNKPDGFGNFFQAQDDPFLVLGSSPNTNIPTGNNNLVPISTAISEDINILAENANQDLLLEFDWIFQGNSTGFAGIRLDTFTVSLVSVETNILGDPVISQDLLIENTYDEMRGESLAISGGLPIGVYNIILSVSEPTVVPDDVITANSLSPTDIIAFNNLLANDNSAAGIDNLTISSVPFEFSPTLGLFFAGSFWGFFFWKKQHKQKVNH